MSSLEDLMIEKKTIQSNVNSLTTAMEAIPDGLPIKNDMKTALDKYLRDLDAISELSNNIKTNLISSLKERVNGIVINLDDLGVTLAQKRNELDEVQSFIDIKRSEKKSIEEEIFRLERSGETEEIKQESVLIDTDKKIYTSRYFASILSKHNVNVSHISQAWIEVVINGEKIKIAVVRSYKDVFKVQMLSNVKFVVFNFNASSPENIESYIVVYTDILRDAIKNGTLIVPFNELSRYKSFSGIGFLQNLLRK